jgi:VCBS repeat-containing protein
VAIGESYVADFGTALSVGPPGVLANDRDPEGRAITAVLKKGPSHGTLSLRSDGGFTYTPATSYSGPDSFTYAVSDGSLESAAVIAAITVSPSSTADTVTIVTATWTRKTKALLVEATSSAAPSAKLTVVGFGEMTNVTGTNRYTYQKTPSTKPASVTVMSTLGGSATKSVSTK